MLVRYGEEEESISTRLTRAERTSEPSATSFLRSSSEMAGGREAMLGEVGMRFGDAGDAPGSEPPAAFALTFALEPVCWSAEITFCARLTIWCSFGSRSCSSCCAACTQSAARNEQIKYTYLYSIYNVYWPSQESRGGALRVVKQH